MYDTNLIVKYYDIKQELTCKLQNKDEEAGYTEDELNDICDKLYKEEFLMAFQAEDIFDDKIDNEIIEIKKLLNGNEKFVSFIDKCIHHGKTTIENNDKYEFIKASIFYSLFGFNLFHITHKCICQQHLTETIDDELITELERYFLSI